MTKKRMYRKGAALAAACCATLLFWGCGAEILTTTAVRGELEAQNVRQANQHLQYAKRSVGALNFSQAVQTYRAEHGVNPPSLEALVPKYLPEIPRKADGTPYHYDPATGTLSETSVAAPVTPQDTQMMQRIREAINQYGTATGYYPPTLDDLHPLYLSQPPRTEAGEPFQYNNQNGEVAHPRAHALQPGRPAAPSAGGGSGPMGEVMTGIGMQQSLGGGGGGGGSAASSAQSHARGGVENISGQHSDRQTQVMDELGL